MKVFIGTFLLLLIVLGSAVNANDGAAISLQSEGADENRLFDLSVVVENIDSIVGGVISLTYEKDVLEYKGVKNKISQAEVFGDNGVVEIVLVAGKNDNITGNIATLSFKGMCTDDTVITLSADKFVDATLEQLKIDTNDLPLSIGEKSVCCTESEVQVKSDRSTITKIDTDSVTEKPQQNDIVSATADSLNVQNNGNKSGLVYYVLGVGAVAVVIVALGIIYIKDKKKNKACDKD